MYTLVNNLSDLIETQLDQNLYNLNLKFTSLTLDLAQFSLT